MNPHYNTRGLVLLSRGIDSPESYDLSAFVLLPHPPTTFHYIGEDTRRSLMFDKRRMEAERLEGAAKRVDGAAVVRRVRGIR